MFDVGFDEMLVIAIVAIIVIGPKDLPMALRTIGRWVAKMRRVSGHFRSGIETMIREAELEEMEKKWREQNEAILNAHPHPPVEAASAEAALPPPASKPEALARQAENRQAQSAQAKGGPEPQLPLPPP